MFLLKCIKLLPKFDDLSDKELLTYAGWPWLLDSHGQSQDQHKVLKHYYYYEYVSCME